MKKILLMVLCLLCLCGCGKENVDNIDKNKITESQAEEKLFEINNWLTTLWNDNINEINWYTNYGTNSVGETFDINFSLKTINTNYSKKDEYYEFINSLDDEKYELIKLSFNKSIEQADIIIQYVKNNPVNANEVLSIQSNIELFRQYYGEFYDNVIELY